LSDPSLRARFERVVLPHLDAAYNLARWLTRNDHDAEDVTQEACARAYRFFETFHDGNARTWLLTIVRRTCYSWLDKHRPDSRATVFDEDVHSLESGDGHGTAGGASPEALLLVNADLRQLRECLEQLPRELREALILRELEGLSYKEISAVTEAPLGTVMSRLARARNQLQRRLAGQISET
jgi:RNA polymerase sigma-70 factor (ECF subfamily)